MTSSQTTPSQSPRFDQFLTAVENRRDNWQRLHGLAQAWAALPTDRRDPGRLDLINEAKQVLSQLETLEGYYAYPGPALIQRLRERVSSGDAAGFADLARRVAKTVLAGTYRRDSSAWDADEDSADAKSRAPVYARGGNGSGHDRLYFEVLVVGSG